MFLSAFVNDIFVLDGAVVGDVVAGVTVILETLLAPHIRAFNLGWVAFVPNDLGNVLLGWSLLVGIDDGVPGWVFVGRSDGLDEGQPRILGVLVECGSSLLRKLIISFAVVLAFSLFGCRIFAAALVCGSELFFTCWFVFDALVTVM